MSATKDKWFKKGISLTPPQLDELINILTKRCGHKVKTRIRSLLTYDLDTVIQNCYWIERFYISGHDDDVHYCAGQSYPCEIKALRNNILKRWP